MTATANRADKTCLGNDFATVAYEDLFEDVVAGSLADLEPIRCNPDPPIDMSEIRTTGGDLNQGDLEDLTSRNIEALVNITKPQRGHRTAIIFTTYVGAAQAFAQGLNQVGISDRSGTGESPDRDRVIADYKAGKFQVLANCALLAEGFDAPHPEAIVLARPTRSSVLFAQMIGRGTRIHPGKSACRVINFACLCGQHKPPTVVEQAASPGRAPEVVSLANARPRRAR